MLSLLLKAHCALSRMAEELRLASLADEMHVTRHASEDGTAPQDGVTTANEGLWLFDCWPFGRPRPSSPPPRGAWKGMALRELGGAEERKLARRWVRGAGNGIVQFGGMRGERLEPRQLMAVDVVQGVADETPAVMWALSSTAGAVDVPVSGLGSAADSDLAAADSKVGNTDAKLAEQSLDEPQPNAVSSDGKYVTRLPQSGASSLVISEDTPMMQAPIDLTSPWTPGIQIERPPAEGLARIDLPGLVDGNGFVVGEEQVTRVGGIAYTDVNGNGVLDYHSSEGWVGVPIYLDSLTSGWAVGSTATSYDLSATDHVYRGQTALEVVAQDRFTGLAFYRNGVQGIPATGLQTLRFAIRSDEPMVLSVSLAGDDGRALVPPRFFSTAGGQWEVQEIDLAEFGDLLAYKSLFFGAETTGTFQLDHVALVAAPRSANSDPLAAASPWGVNLFVHEDFAGDAAFVDVTRTMRRWGPVNEPWLDPSWQRPLTADGVPTEPAAAIMFLTGYEPGLYQLRYRGTGSIGFRVFDQLEGEAFIVPGSQRVEGDEQVASVQITATGIGMALQVLATDVSDPVRDIRLLAPGYRGSAPPVFRDEFLGRLAPFQSLRFMDYIKINWSEAEHWADRRLPNQVIQTTFQASEEGGVAWELLIELANVAKKDAWINIPHRADDDYVRQLAQLWHEQYAVDQKLIVEFSNEIWNPMFGQFHELDQGNYYSAVAPRLVRIREIFAEVWGEDVGRVEIVLAGQAFNTETIAQALRYFDDQGIPAGEVVDAISIGMYAFADVSAPLTSVDEVMAQMLDLSDERAAAEQASALAERYGLRLYAYEAGQHLTLNQVADASLLAAAQNDARMGDVLRGLAAIWQEIGGDLFMYYTLTGNSASTSQWGMLDNLAEPGSVKWDAVLKMLLPLGDADLDGKVTYGDYQVLRNHYAQVGTYWEQGDFDGNRQVNGRDLTTLWQALDVTQLTAGQLTEIRTFAREQGISLPLDSLSIEVSSRVVDEQGVNGDGVGTGPLTMTLRRTGSTRDPLDIVLTSSDATELALPSSARIPAGKSSIVLTVIPVNDGILDGDATVDIKATARGYRGADTRMVVRDVGLGEAEQLLEGATVFLDANGNGLRDPEERSTVTDAAGRYLFDGVGAGSYRVLVDAPTARARASVRPLGVLTYEPSASLQSLAVGQQSTVKFSYVVGDGQGGVLPSGFIELTINGQNDLPVPQPLSFAALEDGAPIVAQVVADDIDADDSPATLTYQLLRPIQEGTISMDARGRLVFDPGEDFQDLDVGQQRTLAVPYRVTDAHGASAESTINIVVHGTDNDRVTFDAPHVVAVGIGGSEWSPAFRSALGGFAGGTDGYLLPLVTDVQLTPLPWTNVNQILVQFDQDVLVQVNDLTVFGVNVASYPIAAFHYDAERFVGVWTLDLTAAGVNSGGIPADKLLISLSDSVSSRRGIRLDGEWLTDLENFANSPTAFPSGNGVAGGDFVARFDVLPGDTNQSPGQVRFVNIVDTAAVRGQTGAAAGGSNYRVTADLNGDGRVDSFDLNLVRARQFSLLPTASPTPTGPIEIVPTNDNPSSEANEQGDPPTNGGHVVDDGLPGRGDAVNLSHLIPSLPWVDVDGDSRMSPPEESQQVVAAAVDQLFATPAESGPDPTASVLTEPVAPASSAADTSSVSASSTDGNDDDEQRLDIDTWLRQLPLEARQCYL